MKLVVGDPERERGRGSGRSIRARDTRFALPFDETCSWGSGKYGGETDY